MPLDSPHASVRHDWTRAEAQAIHDLPFNDLLFRAHTVHRQHFDPNAVQKSRLLSIKTGGCPEDCGYCSQSAHHATGLKATKLLEVDRVVAEAGKAKAAGATRYCMGAAWRNPKPRDMPALAAMIEGVKALGLETCMTLGQLTAEQASTLRAAGLDYYNHNIDTSERYYSEIITTRMFEDRLATLAAVRASGMKVCCGGILGMGERAEDRIDMLVTLANLPEHPESVPINRLMPMDGTPLAHAAPIDAIAFVRAIALARILMPRSFVRLSAGRTAMSDEMQALCFFAGANSIFVGETLLTADNPGDDADARLFDRLGLEALRSSPSPCGEGLGVGGTPPSNVDGSPPPNLPRKGGGTALCSSLSASPPKSDAVPRVSLDAVPPPLRGRLRGGESPTPAMEKPCSPPSRDSDETAVFSHGERYARGA